MLGGDKEFNDRLCWVLVLPLSVMVLCAVRLAFLALEVLFEGDRAGSAAGLVAPLASLCAGYSAVLMGAKVAPDRKAAAAAGLSALYLVWVVWTSLGQAGPLWVLLLAGMGAGGCGWAVWQARTLPLETETGPREKKR